MTFGLIFSAGNQTRFEDKLPKALSKIGDKTLLDINIENMSKYCDAVYVVCSFKNQHYFSDYKTLAIDSGLGCGDAVYKAINLLPYTSRDTCFIQWGDCLHSERVYKETKEAYNGEIMVPCVVEQFPYVQIKCDYSNRKIIEALFTKYKEPVGFGYHDLSLFYGNVDKIFRYCDSFADRFYNDSKELYNSPHGKEFDFLDIFRYCRAEGRVVPIKNYKCLAFNTKEELEEVKKYYEGLSSTEV